jgi:hypothetical protein
MEIVSIPDYTLTRTQGGVSNLRRISTLPVQAMDRIAPTEEADGIRDEEDVSSAEERAAPSDEGDAHMHDSPHSTQDN